MRIKVLGALTLLIAALAVPGEASALVQRTFVSGLGSDTNPCLRTAPCRTFAAAVAQTLVGGEVVALDTAGYGPVTVSASISLISPPGVYAGITTVVPGTDGITVDADEDAVVVLKGLSISGLGVGDFGIRFLSGKTLRVEGVTISGFIDNGIHFAPPETGGRMTVTDSLIRDNAGAGIVALGSVANPARVTIDKTRLLGNFWGVFADAHSRVTVRDSVAQGSDASGIETFADTAVVNVENCLVTDNFDGINSSGLTRVAGTTVTDNSQGLDTDGGGSILSRGNNTVEGNDTNGTFTGAFAAK